MRSTPDWCIALTFCLLYFMSKTKVLCLHCGFYLGIAYAPQLHWRKQKYAFHCSEDKVLCELESCLTPLYLCLTSLQLSCYRWRCGRGNKGMEMILFFKKQNKTAKNKKCQQLCSTFPSILTDFWPAQTLIHHLKHF